METPEIDEILECKKNSTLTIKGQLIFKKKIISVTFFTNTNMISGSINDDKEEYRNIDYQTLNKWNISSEIYQYVSLFLLLVYNIGMGEVDMKKINNISYY